MIVIIEKIIYCSGLCGRLRDVHYQPPPSCLDIKLRRNCNRCEEIVLKLNEANSLKLL